VQNELRQLNADIWLPFSQTYAARDAERYLDLHLADFTWVRAQTGEILGLNQYSVDIRDSFARMAAGGITVDVAFRFTERIASSERASERGIFRVSATKPDGPGPVFHSRFHTIARYMSQRWRFVVDYESSEPVGAAEFAAAHPLDDVEAFGPRSRNAGPASA
jgi:ketosteroid isomerase-like protein